MGPGFKRKAAGVAFTQGPSGEYVLSTRIFKMAFWDCRAILRAVRDEIRLQFLRRHTYFDTSTQCCIFSATTVTPSIRCAEFPPQAMLASCTISSVWIQSMLLSQEIPTLQMHLKQLVFSKITTSSKFLETRSVFRLQSLSPIPQLRTSLVSGEPLNCSAFAR
jgi:hypothetical protein